MFCSAFNYTRKLGERQGGSDKGSVSKNAGVTGPKFLWTFPGLHGPAMSRTGNCRDTALLGRGPIFFTDLRLVLRLRLRCGHFADNVRKVASSYCPKLTFKDIAER